MGQEAIPLRYSLGLLTPVSIFSPFFHMLSTVAPSNLYVVELSIIQLMPTEGANVQVMMKTAKLFNVE